MKILDKEIERIEDSDKRKLKEIVEDHRKEALMHMTKKINPHSI